MQHSIVFTPIPLMPMLETLPVTVPLAGCPIIPVMMEGPIPVANLNDHCFPTSTPPACQPNAPGLWPDWIGIHNNLIRGNLSDLKVAAIQLVLHRDEPEPEVLEPLREPLGPGNKPEWQDESSENESWP